MRRAILLATALAGAISTTARSAADDDEYTPEPRIKGKIVDACGRFKFDVEGQRQLGGGFTPYVYNVRGDVEKLPCTKLVAKNKFGKQVADAVSAMRKDQDDATLVVVQQGKPWLGDKDDGEHYRFITLWAYSKHMKILESPCGGERMLCEAGGNTIAERWNELEHALDRAAAHAGSDPDRCKAQLKVAQTKVQWLRNERAANGTAPYWKTHSIAARGGKSVPLPDVVQRVGELEGELKARFNGTYCSKQAPD